MRLPCELTARHLLLGALTMLASISGFAQDGLMTFGSPSMPNTNVSPGSAASGTSATLAGPANTLQQSPVQGADRLDKANLEKAISEKSNPDTLPAEDPVQPPAARRKAPPTQFQRFVQEATGRLLPLYGHALFEAPQTYRADSALPAPAEYLIGVGDEVRLQVWGALDFNTTLTVDRNGQVNIPKVGVVTLAGVAVRDLDTVLRTKLSKVFNNFSANASLGRLRGIQVYVVGHAQKPGTYHLSSLSTLVNALFASGGPGASGSMRSIELKRAGKVVTTLDLYDFIAHGDKSRDLPLLSGDVIVIPPAGPRVALTGALDQAAIYELKPGGTTLAEILALGGGVPALAKTHKALLERVSLEASPPRQVQEIVLNAQGLQQALRDADVLTLLPISPAFGNTVTLQGVVSEPLRHRWFEGMKILDLIPDREALISSDYYKRKNLLVQVAEPPKDLTTEAKGAAATEAKGTAAMDAKGAGTNVETRVRSMVDQINWDYAVIERLDRSTLSTQLIPFNVGRAVLHKDPIHNIPLQSGDVVTILSQNDLRLPQDRLSRLIRIEGEVAAPGVYQAKSGETLPQLIQRVGGLTPQAYLFGTELNRVSVRRRQQENLDRLIRRLESQSQNQVGKLTANQSADAAQAQLLAQQQSREQIDRLKALKSNGRMALELNPQSIGLTALPVIPLEDGDRIYIPSKPGYVSAFGSVNNENVFIHRPGKTVADVIKSAGLAEDAEPDQAFVLRADGSIIARRDRSGFWGSGGFDDLALMPGDTVVVPAQIDRESRYTATIRGIKDWTQILANFGLSIASIRSLSR